MTPPNIGEGQLLALSRSLASSRDPLAVYSALTDSGTRPDTLLIETDECALIMERAALRVTCRGQQVELVALSDGGLLLLPPIARQLAEYVVESDGRLLKLCFPRTTSQDAKERLVAPSPFDALRALLFSYESLSPEEPFALVIAGILAFDHVDLFEDLPQAREDPIGFPDFRFWLPESLILFGPEGTARIICAAFGSNETREAERSFHMAAERLTLLIQRCSSPVQVAPDGSEARAPVPYEERRRATPDLDDATFAQLVGTLKTHIASGDIYQIVPSRSFSLTCEEPLQSFARQRSIDPSPYMFYVASSDEIVFGASPESAVTLTSGKSRTLAVKPMAGTRARGTTLDEDDRLEADLKLDDKEVAEHMMLVDLARNDVARVSVPGTRRVTKLLDVERYARVMHLTSRVEGELLPELDAFHALQACLNVGTLSGAPKLKATQLLRQYEAAKRGPYGGAVGWICSSGAMNTGVIIRSALVKDGLAQVRVGAGIVQESDPLTEAKETSAKASALLAALQD
ncbi:MAG TPA: anthranilate synthase component 1 [Sphingomicrobium sp.]|nr:anthranilate synthase component 1 [Sphingomicrobium sp.]